MLNERKNVNDSSDSDDDNNSILTSEMKEMATTYNLPTSFGKKEIKDDSFKKKMLQETARSIDEFEASSTMPLIKEFPISNSTKLLAHSKTVSIIEIERNGSRMITASHDYSMAFWEWSSMDSRLLPFRSVEPIEANKLSSVKFSPDGKLVIVSSSSLRPKLYDRHGGEIKEFQSGDPYLRDLKRTGGHTSAITCTGWKQSDRFWTAGMDGTIRTWNPNQHLKCMDVLVLRGPSGMSRCSITAAQLSKDGKMFAVASIDGHVRIIPDACGARDSQIHLDFPNAHVVGTETSALEFHPLNENIFATRGGDDTVKVWDIRNNKNGPISIRTGLENPFSEAGLAWAPQDGKEENKGKGGKSLNKNKNQNQNEIGNKSEIGNQDQKEIGNHDHGYILLTGTGIKNKSQSKSELVFIDTLNTENGNDDYRIQMSNYSLAAINWPSSLNQIFVGEADGSISIFYDPQKSSQKGGILVPLSKKSTLKIQTIYENEIGGPIMIPFAQDAKTALRAETDYGFGYNSEIPYSDVQIAMKRTTNAGYCADRHDPIKSHKPETGLEGPGRGGKLGSTITQSIMKSVLAEKNKRIREEDPREAILRYAKVAEENPYFVSPAYKTTQPFPLLDENLLRDEKEKQRKKIESEETKKKLLRK